MKGEMDQAQMCPHTIPCEPDRMINRRRVKRITNRLLVYNLPDDIFANRVTATWLRLYVGERWHRS